MTSSESKEPQGSRRSSNKCRCGHSGAWHPFSNGGACTADGCCCLGLVCDHSTCGWKPREDKPRQRCRRCGNPIEWVDHTGDPGWSHSRGPEGWVCDDPTPLEDEEPPLTPEEEEEQYPACEHCGNWHAPDDECVHTEEPLPQPERRPPYLVAYSVSGHLYEVALSGDATVRAVDGALVIQHHLGPVAGIVQVLPVINKESNA